MISNHLQVQEDVPTLDSKEWRLREMWLCAFGNAIPRLKSEYFGSYIPFTDSSHLHFCSSGEGVSWFGHLRAVRLSKDHQRCSESYCGNSSVLLGGGDTWQNPSHSLCKEGEPTWQDEARHPSGVSQRVWSRWIHRLGQMNSYKALECGGKGRKEEAWSTYLQMPFHLNCSSLHLVYILVPSCLASHL